MKKRFFLLSAVLLASFTEGMALQREDAPRIQVQPKQELYELSRRPLEKNREEGLHFVTYQGKMYQVEPNVFSPKIFRSSFFTADHLMIQPHEHFLEIGSGSGLVSIVAALRGADRVVATDIRPEAVENTRLNVKNHYLGNRITVLQGDIFQPIAEGDKFDTIFWNPPFMHAELGERDALEYALYDPEHRSLHRFMEEAKEYVKPGGRILLGYSKTYGDEEVLQSLAEHYGWELVPIAEKTMTFDDAPGEEGRMEYNTVLYEGRRATL